jgi:A/G-specific adenine glycosylase
VRRRALPWRAPAGKRSDPYQVWLSEIMLQQTTVAAVGPYYAKFLRNWPTVEALAAAKQDDVLAAWAGLGYYARARNLHRAAQVVARELGGKFPGDAEGLRKLPGVGDYTAGAVAAIAFDAPEVAIDANAERVLARFFAVQEALPKAKSRLRALGRSLLPATRPGDFAQALMDLGATICTPKSPACRECPWRADCRARVQGNAEQLPRKAEKRARHLRRGAAFVVRSGDAVLLERRPENGLLGAMMQPPMTPWGVDFLPSEEVLRLAPFVAAWKKQPGVVRHVFTHFELELEVYTATVGRRVSGQTWVAVEDLIGAALPTVMRKVLEHAGASALKAAEKSIAERTK